MRSIRELGRDGDFDRVPDLRRKYKSHRTTSPPHPHPPRREQPHTRQLG